MGYGHHAYDYVCSSIKCSKCENWTLQLPVPLESLHINIVHIDGIDNFEIVKNVHIPSEVTSDTVDELIKSTTPIFDEIHVHEESISDV